MVGEVSLVNDDDHDNRFLEPVGRFADIEEDEPPIFLLRNDYERYWERPALDQQRTGSRKTAECELCSVTSLMKFYPLPEALAVIAEAGYQGVELWGGLPHAYTDDFYLDGG